MPSVTGKQHRTMEAAKHNRAFARKVGIPQSVARDFVAADRAAGKFQGRKISMARRHGAEAHSGGMGGEKGISPRKAMASGEAHGGGTFGVESFHEANGHMGPHPDHVAHTGMDGHLADHERGAGPGIHHTRHHHPAQAAPDHGPHHVDGYGHHDRGESGGI